MHPTILRQCLKILVDKAVEKVEQLRGTHCQIPHEPPILKATAETARGGFEPITSLGMYT